MPIEYAHALHNSLKGVTKDSEVNNYVDALISTLKKSGKLKALPSILREFERIQLKKNSHKPKLTIANESHKAGALKELEGKIAGSSSDITITIDQNIVGGWRYENNDTLLDTSYKAALIELYRRITAV